MSSVPGLRHYRKRQALSQADLAIRAGVTRSTIISAETGQASPRPSTIRRLAEALGVSPSELQDVAS